MPRIQELVRFGSEVIYTVGPGVVGEVYKVFPWGVSVWIKDAGFGEGRREWSWRMITVRQPRQIKRYPRPFRFIRKVRTSHCHCKIGSLEVRGIDVYCLRCKSVIGTESFPNRIDRATILYSKTHIQVVGAKGKIPKRILHK